MNVSLYQAAAAMDAQARWQELIADNLAAGAVPGYRKLEASFAEVAAASPVMVNNAASSRFYIPTVVASTSFQQGQLRPTGNSLDLALDGPGFFAVQLPNGETAYTRNGEFQLNATGQLVTAQGSPVLSDAGPVQLDPNNPAPITISADGQISQGAEIKGRLKVVTFANPHALTPTANGYLLANGQLPAPAPPSTAVRQGFLEAANTSPTTEMSSLITAMRLFEANQKVIQMQNDRMGQIISDLGGTD